MRILQVMERRLINMQLRSVFNHNEQIPTRYTCDGEDINPKLDISDVPPGAKSMALIVDDPDAPMGTWVHWVVWNIPSDRAGIEENAVPTGAVQGTNSWNKLGYGGPCPPSGTHRYFFKLYALDIEIDLKQGASKEELEKAMKGHILEQAELIGLYNRG
jgi:Raf kinase inhibitor-like YbhB/YbcL family protein